MVRTNVCAKWGSVFFALFFLLNCDATTRRPAQQIVAGDHASNAPPSVMSMESIPTSSPNMMPMQDPYDDAPLNDPVDLPNAEPSSSSSSSSAAAPSAEPNHYAELRGRIESQTGLRLTIEPLVSTSATLPITGSTANLWIEATEEDGTSDWQHFAEVKVVASLQFGMAMEFDIVDDETGPNSGKPERVMLAPGSRVRVQWEW